MLVGVMLVLSVDVTLQSQVAQARKQNNNEDASDVPKQQHVDQKIKCSSDAVCLAKAINILCMKDSLCYIGYNAPFLFSTPH